ncbi:Z1 domain-containing protein [Enterobacter wuhouensis]|uniref:Z1 domain-containing protein n=1 Tax=Enterobacter wuhouensis TaxID=2529381 RepID=A0ABZ1DJW0_9ENTR|nr:Z1 domain-containing protein [Enterobacter wuhouensis]WRW32134.1 Z1 domain-containing protein [Enterobacter wuhouensis]
MSLETKITFNSNGINWTPKSGEETGDFLGQSGMPDEAKNKLLEDAISILSRGVPPQVENGFETGLVVGYVQSGKTMSFETVAALARDNGFHIVIVIAGTSNPLLAQSSNRLKKDLGLNDVNRGRRWVQLENPTSLDSDGQMIRNTLSISKDSSTDAIYKKTILITVLKNHTRIKKLAEIFEALDLNGTSVLIIDDEADQVSLNTEASQGEESATYSCLIRLRNALPNHTYLQYTATPQAPLLINIIDSLSPNFVKVLEPGDAYIGGRDFFDRNSSYIKLIPSNEVPTKDNPLTYPPSSLLDALRIFMLGVAVGIKESGNTGNRSMLVHPSHLTAQHKEFYGWVRSIFDEWQTCLALPDSDLDKIDLLNEFRKSYNHLKETTCLPPFEQVANSFGIAFKSTQIVEVNSRKNKTPAIDWQHNYGWILVGGIAVDRGFTVEGLTVTYMPRGVGVGNADTIQQRARFFGYKKNYLGFCRVYLEQSTLEAFRNYVTHEEDIRKQLKIVELQNKPLDSWKRAFLLDLDLKPCRDSVLEFDYMHTKFSDKWIMPKLMFPSNNIVSDNRETTAEFLSHLSFVSDVGHNERTKTQKHLVCDNVLLKDLYENLLIKLRVTGSNDSQTNTAMLLHLAKAIENDITESCIVYRMSPNERRIRKINSYLFQGAYPVESSRRGEIYLGDAMIKDPLRVSVQIHYIDLKMDNQRMISDVPVVAVWIPKRLACSVLVQNHN